MPRICKDCSILSGQKALLFTKVEFQLFIVLIFFYLKAIKISSKAKTGFKLTMGSRNTLNSLVLGSQARATINAKLKPNS